MTLPAGLQASLAPVTVVVGHYGSGKTNFTMNLALDLARDGAQVAVVDLDIVNPYFRVSEQRPVLERAGIELVAPVFSEAGTSLDVPSLTGRVAPAVESAGEGRYVLMDVGGDDAGSVALGRYARGIAARGYSMLYVANRFRNLVQDAADAAANLREVETASRLSATAIVNNSHLQGQTDADAVFQGLAHARELSALCGLPVACTTVPEHLHTLPSDVPNPYRVHRYVKPVWD